MPIVRFKMQVLAVAALCSFLNISASTVPAQAPLLHTQNSQDFTRVAGDAIPAVVSIKVETKKHSHGKSHKSTSWDAEEDKQTRLWKHFFGDRDDEQGSEEPSIGQGSGFIVSPDGYILTNNHVVQNVDVITVTLNDGRELTGKVIGQDSYSDVALIKIEAQNLPFLKLGNSDLLEVAQPVMAIGTPAGLQATVTVGVVSAKRRNNLDLARIEDFIQTDAAINRGNSGGPLLNIDGEVIGLNTAMASSLGGYMGIGFAIPSNIAKNVMDQLLTQGSIKRSFIGVELQPVDHNLAEVFGLPKIEGALVSQVLKDSPAENGKMMQGDVIVKLNNAEVLNVGSFRTAIALMTPGTKVMLSIIREGKNLDLPITTGEFASTIETHEKSTQDNTLGMVVANLSHEAARQFGLTTETGVIVTSVEAGSSAQMAGLRKGALIISLNHRKIESADQFIKEINAMDKSKPILLLVKEGNRVHYLSFKIG